MTARTTGNRRSGTRKQLSTLALAASVVAWLAGAASPAKAQSAACGQTGPDAAIEISDLSNFNPVGDYDAVALGAWVLNIGSMPIAYRGCPNVHPVFGGNLYRYSIVDGAARFEQVGMSWLKHTAVAAQSGNYCTCVSATGGTLGPGCGDLYSAGFQSSQGTLGPRYQVNAFTGQFNLCPPHPSGGNFGRLEFALSDLTVTPGGASALTRYFVEEQVVAPDDAAFIDAGQSFAVKGLNNASSAEVSVAGTASNFTLALLTGDGGSRRGVAAIQRWKLMDPTVTEAMVDVPSEGRFIISSKATNLGGSPAMWRYEYAVFNLNSDRSGGRFFVPLPPGVSAVNVGFHGVLYRGGDGINGVNADATPWTAVVSENGIEWRSADFSANPNANAIRWSTLYNFRFDCGSPPAASGGVRLGLFKPGTPGYVFATAQAPACAGPVIERQPSGGIACPTGSLSVSIGAVGPGSLSYQWQIEVAPNDWRTLGNDPMPLTCSGGAGNAFAFATPPFSGTVNIGVRPCPGVSSYRLRCVVGDSSGCTSASSSNFIYTVCAADFNCSGGVSVQDIFEYLAAWFAGDARADVNGVGGVTVQDLLEFVASWFAGC